MQVIRLVFEIGQLHLGPLFGGQPARVEAHIEFSL
jgi:hypothetical protein